MIEPIPFSLEDLNQLTNQARANSRLPGINLKWQRAYISLSVAAKGLAEMVKKSINEKG